MESVHVRKTEHHEELPSEKGYQKEPDNPYIL